MVFHLAFLGRLSRESLGIQGSFRALFWQDEHARPLLTLIPTIGMSHLFRAIQVLQTVAHEHATVAHIRDASTMDCHKNFDPFLK